jgi:CcmD family protein
VSEWGFVRVAYGLTWIVLAVYSVYLRRRRVRARSRLEASET